MSKNLNIGCGDDYLQNFINVDLPDNNKADIKLNLEDAKLPFDNNEISFIQAKHVLEHVINLSGLMKEFHRILHADGILYIKVPYFKCEAAFADPTHVRYFSPITFAHFTDDEIGYKTSKTNRLFKLGWLSLIRHSRPTLDNGVDGSYFTEIEAELIAVK